MWINGVYVGIFRFRGIYIYNIIYGIYMIYIYMGYSMGKSSWEYGTSNPQDLVLRVCLMVSLDGFSAVKMGRRSPVTQKLIFFGLTTPTRDGVWKTNHFTRIEWGFTGIYILYTHIQNNMTDIT
jgi:hypothetical protein